MVFYGDTNLLEKCYLTIRRYVDHITETTDGNLTYWGLGDRIPVTKKTYKFETQ